MTVSKPTHSLCDAASHTWRERIVSGNGDHTCRGRMPVKIVPFATLVFPAVLIEAINDFLAVCFGFCHAAYRDVCIFMRLNLLTVKMPGA